MTEMGGIGQNAISDKTSCTRNSSGHNGMQTEQAAASN